MNTKKEFIVIVDAYSGANQYAPLFREKGFSCIHIQSDPLVPTVYQKSFHPSDFAVHLVHRGDMKETIRALASYQVRSLLTGIESGVELADRLSEAMGVLSNGTKLSAARRNKFLMQEAIALRGLRSIRQFKSNHVDGIISWAKAKNISPVVIKPLASAGTDSVMVCQNENEIQSAFAAIINKKNALGLLNEEVLAQEYIEGTEYVINTVSCHGVRQVTDIIRYTKQWVPHGGHIYERDDFLDQSGELAASLVDYNHKVLDALEIDHGPSHAEIYFTTRGPVLVEVAARIDGLANTKLSALFSSGDPIRQTVNVYTDPKTFLKTASVPLTLYKQAAVIYPNTRQAGTIVGMRNLEEIRCMPSFQDINLKVKIGDRIEVTTDLFTCPAYIFLLHEDSRVLEADVKRIREMEKTGLFELEQRAEQQTA